MLDGQGNEAAVLFFRDRHRVIPKLVDFLGAWRSGARGLDLAHPPARRGVIHLFIQGEGFRPPIPALGGKEGWKKVMAGRKFVGELLRFEDFECQLGFRLPIAGGQGNTRKAGEAAVLARKAPTNAALRTLGPGVAEAW